MKTRNDTPVTAFSANAAKGVENLLNSISTRVSGYLLPYFVSPDHFWHASRTYFQQRHTKKSHWSHENAQWYASYRIFGKRCERRGEFTELYINKGIRLSSSLFCFARTIFGMRLEHTFSKDILKNRTDRMKTRNDTPVTAFSANAAKGVENLLNSISTRVSGYLLPYFVSPDHFWHASRTYFQQRHTKKSHWSHENAQWYASYRIFGKRCERRGEFTELYINKGIRLSSSLFCFARLFLACV